MSIVTYKKIAYKELFKIVQSDDLFSANYFIKFQPQFKPLNQGLECATKMELQSVLGVGLQIVAKWITKSVSDYKVWQGRLQSASGITKCGVIAK